MPLVIQCTAGLCESYLPLTQGFVRDLEADVEGLRLFAASSLEMLVAQASK